MASQYEPVDLSKIEEGKFLSDCDREFASIQDYLIQHARRYPSVDQCNKAELVMKVIVTESNGQYGVVTEVQKKLPGRPKGITVAIDEESNEGSEFAFGLFARKIGTSKDDPAQMRFDEEEIDDD